MCSVLCQFFLRERTRHDLGKHKSQSQALNYVLYHHRTEERNTKLVIIGYMC